MRTATILVLTLLAACSVFKDIDDLKSQHKDSQSDSSSTTDISTDTTTTTQWDSDSSSDTCTDTRTDTFADTHTDSQSDTTSSSDTQTDTHTTTESETDSSSDTHTDSATSQDSDTGLDCVGMDWTCGSGENNLGLMINCDTPGCPNTGQWCDEAHSCQPCNQHFACGDACTNCTQTNSPLCALDGSTCVECNADSDCRLGGANPSPLGICTPNHNCTCWVPDTDLSSDCTATSCPLDYVCAIDKTGAFHSACLRTCSHSQPAEHGLTCQARNTADDPVHVWAPVTTCYAYNQFGKDCEADAGESADHDKCRIPSLGLDDGQCEELSLNTFRCTYSCWEGSHDDSLCPKWPEDIDACVSPGDYCRIE